MQQRPLDQHTSPEQASEVAGRRNTSATAEVMKTMGVRELRKDASELLRRIQTGEEITITLSGRPTARLVPTHPDLERDRQLLDEGLRTPWATAHAHDARLCTRNIDDFAGQAWRI